MDLMTSIGPTSVRVIALSPRILRVAVGEREDGAPSSYLSGG
jgi:hypothetical protein